MDDAAVGNLIKLMKVCICNKRSLPYYDELLSYGYFLVGIMAVEIDKGTFDKDVKKFLRNKLWVKNVYYRRRFLREKTTPCPENKPTAPESFDYDLTKLTQRQQQIIKLKLSGMTSREAASELAISEHTVCVELDRIRLQLGVQDKQ